MGADSMSADQLRAVIEEAQAALAKIMAEDNARAAVTEAVAAYADTTGVTVVEAWTILAPAPAIPVPAPEPITAPDWVLPEHPDNAYNIGDRATYQGAVYEATRDGIMWSPIAFPMGWRKL